MENAVGPTTGNGRLAGSEGASYVSITRSVLQFDSRPDRILFHAGNDRRGAQDTQRERGRGQLKTTESGGRGSLSRNLGEGNVAT